MSTEQIYSEVADLITLLKSNSQEKVAERLEQRMYKENWASSSELLKEIASVLERFLKGETSLPDDSKIGEKVNHALHNVLKEIAKEDRRSLVRIEIWLLEAIYFAFWLALRFGDLARNSGLVIFTLAAVISVAFFFVRCEKCHTSQIWRHSGILPIILSWRGLFPSKHCSVCGKERF